MRVRVEQLRTDAGTNPRRGKRRCGCGKERQELGRGDARMLIGRVNYRISPKLHQDASTYLLGYYCQEFLRCGVQVDSV